MDKDEWESIKAANVVLRERAEALAKALADLQAYSSYPGDIVGDCQFCGVAYTVPAEHAPDCKWRAAEERATAALAGAAGESEPTS